MELEALLALNGLTRFAPYAGRLAELTAEYAVRIAEGEEVEELNSKLATINNNYGDIPVLWLEPEIVNKDNIDEIIINSGFHTHGEVYRDR